MPTACKEVRTICPDRRPTYTAGIDVAPQRACMLGGAMTERPLDRNSPIPLYFQIAENLKQAIEDGTLKPGQRLDNELDLTERLGVSRPTVRQAVQRLVEQGLVVRPRGLGTVVLAPRILRSVALTSLYDDLSASDRHPATTVLAAREIQADDELASALALPAGGEQVIGARHATAHEARLLQAPRTATVLTMTRTTFDAAGRPVEHGSHAYLPDRYSFKMTL